jgi:hypothetical protein
LPAATKAVGSTYVQTVFAAKGGIRRISSFDLAAVAVAFKFLRAAYLAYGVG